MRIGYLECFAGISGDMLMAALVDAGAPIDLLQRTAASLNLGAELQITRVSRSGIQSTKIDVMVDGRLHEPVQPSSITMTTAINTAIPPIIMSTTTAAAFQRFVICSCMLT
jgi:uncharacterized protein (DUF111 family)